MALSASLLLNRRALLIARAPADEVGYPVGFGFGFGSAAASARIFSYLLLVFFPDPTTHLRNSRSRQENFLSALK